MYIHLCMCICNHEYMCISVCVHARVCMCMCEYCLYMGYAYEHRCSWRFKASVFPTPEFIGGCEFPKVGTGGRTLFLWKNRVHF